jgi:hypothetical protein
MAEEETFKVRDRRRRDDDDVPASPPPREPARPTEPIASTPHSEADGPRVVSPSTPSQQEGPDLRGLFIMLASSALVNLGEAADPATGERVFDLEQAKEAIDLLGLLRIKTNGNRTDQESHLLEEMLYDLQMRFVNAARSATGR